jgi:hypothetical protein
MAESRPRGRPKSFHDKTEQNTVQSLDRAMGILRGGRGTGLTLTELAQRTEQSPATVYRVLSTCRPTESSRWRPPGSFGMWALARGASALPSCAAPMWPTGRAPRCRS